MMIGWCGICRYKARETWVSTMGTKFDTRTHTHSRYTRGVRAGREGQGEGYTSNSTMHTMVCVVPSLL